MLFDIDFNSQEAIYVQLRNQIVLEIAHDHLHDGDSLPSVRTLASDLGVNMHTVNKAYTMLKNEGYVRIDRRRGAYISVEIQSKQDELDKLQENMNMIVAHAICKEISQEELECMIRKMYHTFSDIL